MITINYHKNKIAKLYVKLHLFRTMSHTMNTTLDIEIGTKLEEKENNFLFHMKNFLNN